MRVVYKSNSLETICENAEKATKKYGSRMAELIQLRIDQIRATDSVETLVRFRIGRCHLLVGNRTGQYAMDLEHPQRLIFEKQGVDTVAVRIIDIADYH